MKRIVVLAAALTVVPCALANAAEPSLQWEIKRLAIDSNEGIDVADFDKDGRLDVIAGRNWYAAPDFVPRPVRTIEDWNGYVESNGDFAWDVDGDGLTDVIAGSFVPTEVYWYKNPGKAALALGKMWPRHLLADTRSSQNEGQMFQDLDGDGRPEWVVNSWRKDAPMLVWKLSTGMREVESPAKNKNARQERVPVLQRVLINERGNGHGMGLGDINGDGRDDILSGSGWYECPAEGPFAGPWKYHADWNIHASIPVIVRDLDKDGRNDVIWGKGHDFGLQWWRNMGPSDAGKLRWETMPIDNDFSQPHCLHMADLDGDGQDELITGKRFHAHNGRDPGGEMKPCLYYYRWNAKTKSFSKHIIDEGMVGTGLQIRTADLNGDGRLDIAVAGKSGTYVVFNKGPR